MPRSPSFPTISNLLADSSSAGLANALAPFVAVAHRHKLPFRLTEINTASCQGQPGVSDTFASALWGLNTMFNLARQGVDGVNFHMLPGSHYELFTPSQTASGTWQAAVHPVYYGLNLFAQAFPVGARLVTVTAPSGPTKVWATQAGDGTVRVTLINQDPTAEHDVQVQIPKLDHRRQPRDAHRAEHQLDRRRRPWAARASAARRARAPSPGRPPPPR